MTDDLRVEIERLRNEALARLEAPPTEADVAAAHKAISQHVKYKTVSAGPSPRWGGKDFRMLMWLGTATAVTVVAFPWGAIAYPVLGLLAAHYESKRE